MKKFFYSILAAATMLFATTSCSQEEEIVNGGYESGKTQKVTFKVELPGEATSRAIASGVEVGKGNMANHLRYALYEVNDEGNAIGDGTPLKTGMVEETIDKEFTVDIDMVKGLKYKILFLAYNKDNCIFQLAEEDNDGDGSGDDLLTLNLNGALLSNQESYDAFVACHAYNTLNKERKNTVTLYRPFAQINVGTTAEDIKQAGILKATVVESALAITDVPTQYNVFSGKATEKSTVEYSKSQILYQDGTQKNEILDVNGAEYNYLNMVYVLAGDKTTTDATYTFYREGDSNAIRTIEVKNLPYERNYRTNIVGSIITKQETFKIIIDSDFLGDHTNEHFEQDEYGTYHISSAEGLMEFMEKVEAGEMTGATVTLDGDIDLANFNPAGRSAVASNWTPIGTSEKPFSGTFDGKGYTIKNLALVEEEAKEGKAYIGFFGYAKDATIKNVTFENVYINIPCLDIDHSQGHIGAVAGSLEGTSTIENVTVKGDIKVEATQDANGASRVAVVAGGNSYGNVTMKNVHVIANEGSYLIANNNTGALAGQLQGKMYFENCTSNIDVTVNKFFAGGLVGIAAGDSKFIDCHTTGDVAVVAGRAGRANDHYRVGGIAGGWADGKTKVCTLENCSYTGKVSGTNADGSVAEVLDYMGYVGRGYTLSNCAGSKVIIDGTEFIQKYDKEYGIYTINVPVSTADELVAALEANNGVIFMNDIKIEPAKMSNAYGKTGINVKNGQTINGNGYTLNIKGAGGTWDSGINTTGGLIKNITVTGSFRGIFINHTSTYSEKVVLENVTIGGNGTVYTISCDQGLYQGIEATNCTFNGWTSFAKTAGEAKFINCNFGEGSGYKYCRPYSNTEFVNCTFCPGYAVDTTRATVTFTDCTWEE